MLPLAITIPAGPVAISLGTGMANVGVQGLVLQPDDGATGPMFIGDAAVTTAVYGIRINAPAGGVPPVPLVLMLPGFSMAQLSQLFVIGTAGDILRGFVIPR